MSLRQVVQMLYHAGRQSELFSAAADGGGRFNDFAVQRHPEENALAHTRVLWNPIMSNCENDAYHMAISLLFMGFLTAIMVLAAETSKHVLPILTKIMVGGTVVTIGGGLLIYALIHLMHIAEETKSPVTLRETRKMKI